MCPKIYTYIHICIYIFVYIYKDTQRRQRRGIGGQHGERHVYMLSACVASKNHTCKKYMTTASMKPWLPACVEQCTVSLGKNVA